MGYQTNRTKSQARPRVASASQSGERESAGFRAALPSLDAPQTPTPDPGLEDRLFALVTAVAQEEGRTYPPEWLTVVYEAKKRNLVSEKGLSLHLSDMGRQWLNSRAPVSPKGARYEMTKIALTGRLKLKELAHETGVPMQEAIGDIIRAMYDNRAALTRAARAHGRTYPWEAIEKLVKGQ